MGSDEKDQGQVLINDILTAREEWLLAKRYVANAEDDEIKKHALYIVSACERRYLRLLRQARSSRTPVPSGVILEENGLSNQK